MANDNHTSLHKSWRNPRRWLDAAMTTVAASCLGAALVPLGALLVFVTVRGIGRLDWALLTELPPAPGMEGGGLANALLGTVMVLLVALVISVPFGVLGALYLSEFDEGSAWGRQVRFATNILSGVPSIIAGLFVFGFLIRTGLTNYSALAGGAALSVVMLPTIVRTSEEALQLVPDELRWAALGAGATRYRTVREVVLPSAAPAIVTGITLAVARAAGETAPLIFTALFSPFWPESFGEPIATLSVLVYNFASVPFAAQQDLAWAAALILIGLIFVAKLLATLVVGRRKP
ncbi:MAG: phosphate ABC transporter permease PstA [Myxococcales bacterium]|nr:phosphate ABC transporter permease PstA [Myxococcales bacterium]